MTAVVKRSRHYISAGGSRFCSIGSFSEACRLHIRQYIGHYRRRYFIHHVEQTSPQRNIESEEGSFFKPQIRQNTGIVEE
jgi:hypothetical protein